MNAPCTPILLSMRNIHVAYGSIKALKGVDFDLNRGEIHALVGEHRAGKSSLVKLLSGAERRKQGEIILEGKSLSNLSPQAAAALGIGMVYQSLTVVPDLDAVDNMFIGQSVHRSPVAPARQSRLNSARLVFDRIGFSIDLDIPLYRMRVVEQHMVEFARALLIDPKILILDELSNKLTPDEMKKVYRIIFELKSEGKSVIYISHDIDEVLRLADRVTILKNGYRRETVPVKNLDNFRLFQMTYSFSLNQEKFEYAQNRLTLIRDYVASIVQNLPVGVILVDSATTIQLVNYAAVDILDHKRESIMLRPLREILRFDSVVNEEVLKGLDDRASRTWEEIEFGDQKLVRLSIFPLWDGEDNCIGSTVVLQDIAIDKHLNDYLIQTEKMASVAEMAVGVAHEINNPLYVIQNYVELIKEHVDGSDTREKIELIEEQLDRIVEVIASLLSFSRIKNVRQRCVSLRQILDDVLILLHHSLTEKRIRVTTSFPSGDFQVMGDENKLKQLFINLMRNSIEAVLDNGSIALSLTYDAEGSFAEITVQDDGTGIPEEVEDKIFNPFFSTKVNKNNTGLGLSICRHIVEEHLGSIAFSTIPGNGTTFTVRLPAGQ